MTNMGEATAVKGTQETPQDSQKALQEGLDDPQIREIKLAVEAMARSRVVRNFGSRDLLVRTSYCRMG